MTKGKITPKTVLHFNKKVKKEETPSSDEVTVENILEKASSDNVSDAMKNLYGVTGFVNGVKAINPKNKVAGFIRTVDTNSNDWGTGIKGIYACKEGEILFIKCSNNNLAVWGGLASRSAQMRGIKATVIVGMSRDTQDILDFDFPVFSKGYKSCAGLPLNEGSIDTNLLIDNVVIKSGDFAVCDIDGVVVVPKEKLDEVIEEVNRIKKFENDCFKKLTEDKQHLDDIIGF